MAQDDSRAAQRLRQHKEAKKAGTIKTPHEIAAEERAAWKAKTGPAITRIMARGNTATAGGGGGGDGIPDRLKKDGETHIFDGLKTGIPPEGCKYILSPGKKDVVQLDIIPFNDSKESMKRISDVLNERVRIQKGWFGKRTEIKGYDHAIDQIATIDKHSKVSLPGGQYPCISVRGLENVLDLINELKLAGQTVEARLEFQNATVRKKLGAPADQAAIAAR